MPSKKDLANAVRVLSMDAIQRANSGHPGAPLGMADIAEVLWNDFMKHNPLNPDWEDRDRFVFSNGHGSMLLYSLLHLSGYDLDIEDIKKFRQLHSKTPGHPEYGVTPGVETTTGPLGQGVANAVGMAMVEKNLASCFNRPGFNIVDHYTYVFMGDGCMMEGVSHEACSLAGTLGLGKLIVFWDDNGISIDGEVTQWFDENTAARFEAYGWHVVADVDGHNAAEIKQAVEEARAATDKPSLICCKTVIGCGAPNACGSHKCHGAPLGYDEIAAARRHMNWDAEPFVIPTDIYKGWDATERGAQAEEAWKEMFERYREQFPNEAMEFTRRSRGEQPINFEREARVFLRNVAAAAEDLATRKASQKAIDGFAPLLPEMVGGSADLTSSNLTNWSGSKTINKSCWEGNYISFGVREFAMAAIANGMALHGGAIPYTGTFLVFSDYSRNALRMAGLMGLRSIHVLTHDSIGVGEDGPTHQPIEHTASLRLIPNMSIWRPCDTFETAVAWKAALQRKSGPTGLILSRQTLPFQKRTQKVQHEVAKGGYVLRDCKGAPDALIIATGSEVSLAVEAAKILESRNRRVRVVSMPCVDVFLLQDEEYQESVLPPELDARLAIEAGSPETWRRFVGRRGEVMGMNSFGESAPGDTLFEFFGFTVENVCTVVEQLIKRKKGRRVYTAA